MSIFKFRQFDVKQADSAMKIGTDAMIFGALIETRGKKQALDIGTGTGVLSLMAAQQNPQLQVTAIEIEANAAREARHNFENSPFRDRLKVLHQDFLTLENQSFDLIFSNPPYFGNAYKSGVQERDFARHDDVLPLGKLFQRISELLSDDGHCWLILPHLTMDQYAIEAVSLGLFLQKEVSVFGKKDQLVRKISCFSKTQKEPVYETLVVRNADGSYTEQYKELTREFHWNVL